MRHQESCCNFATIVKFMILCVIFMLFILGNTAEGKKRSQRRPKRLTNVSHRNYKIISKRNRKNEIENPVVVPRKIRDKPKQYRKRFRSRNGKKPNRKENYRIENIKNPDLSIPGFYQLMKPGERITETHSPMESPFFGKVVRTERLYCRSGFHLEINQDGTISSNNKPRPEGVLEIFSVKRSIVGIRSARTSLYLCMGKKGKLFTRKRFMPDCEFLENFEANKYNTYASVQYSNHERRVGFFLAISRHGRFPRKMKKVNWKEKRAHWLIRKV